MADIYAEVSAVGIQGLSGGGTTGIISWDPVSTYNQYDIVSYQGNLYYWISSTPGNSLTNPSVATDKWQLSTGAGGGNGATGVQGASGATGSQGPVGASGTGGGGGSGATGSTGAQGVQGASGVAGSTGPQGIQGASGTQGINGASGYIGHDGATGPQGASGSAGATGSSISIIGSVYDSSYLPDPYTGNVGDGYITEDTGHLYVWDGSQWIDVGSFTGPQGASGISGASGVRGATGVRGASGVQGASGISGASGYIGHDGATGAAGATGAGLTTIVFTTSSTDEVVVETIDSAVYRSAKYDMQITSTDNYMATEFRVLVDDPNVYMTEYGAIGDYLGTFATYYSPLNNDYSSEINNGGLSVHNNTSVTIYTTNNNVIQGLLSIEPGTLFNLNNSVNVTLTTKFTEVDAGIYTTTVAENRFPPLMITRIKWTGTGHVELRFTPTFAVSTLKYNRVLIEK